MRIGIIVAMDKEFDLVTSLMDNKLEQQINGFLFITGNIYEKSVILCKCGIGKVCSAVGTIELIHNFAPDCIINTGVAGGIDPSLSVMDVVIGENIVYHDVWCGEGNAYGQVQGFPLFFRSAPSLYRDLYSSSVGKHLRRGLICSGDKFITDTEELAHIKSNFPEGLAVDMESCSIAQVCYMADIPFLSMRIISDTPGVVQHEKQYENFWQAAPEKSFRIIKKLIKLISNEEDTQFHD